MAALMVGSVGGQTPAPGNSDAETSGVRMRAKSAAILASVSNDYCTKIKTRTRWLKFPVTVYFARDKEYSPSREQEARIGFSRWTEATHGYIAYKVVEAPQGADMTVTFNPESDDGYTTTQFSGGRLKKANIKVGVQRGWAHDIECVAAHEFGHALGLNGHSDRVDDLMFPTHNMGSRWSITQRDLNTLAAIYRPSPRLLPSWIPTPG